MQIRQSHWWCQQIDFLIGFRVLRSWRIWMESTHPHITFALPTQNFLFSIKDESNETFRSFLFYFHFFVAHVGPSHTMGKAENVSSKRENGENTKGNNNRKRFCSKNKTAITPLRCANRMTNSDNWVIIEKYFLFHSQMANLLKANTMKWI